MNDHQLRGYFSWRTRVRRGIIEKTSLSFVFVYIYELLNKIGVRSPEEGFHTLKNFWTVYKKIDSGIDRYAKLWLKDYVVYNNLDKILLEDILDGSYNDAVLTLLNYNSHSADEVFSALNSLSSYDLKNSRFFKQHPEDIKNVVHKVFSTLSSYHNKNYKYTLCEDLLGKVYVNSYYMFSSAVFYDQTHQKDFVYEINDLYKYICKNGYWSCMKLFFYRSKSMQIKMLLKTIDFLMRKKYNFKPAINAVNGDRIQQNIISKVIDSYLEKQREAAIPKIEIDVSKLQGIRNAALETQSKLLVEEPEEPEEADKPEFSDEKAGAENDIGLSDTEYLFMRRLLYGKEYDGLIRSKGMPLSVLVDSINENLFDRFADTVIIETGGQPELIADYVEELKCIIKE
jgi:hypothetical protein